MNVASIYLSFFLFLVVVVYMYSWVFFIFASVVKNNNMYPVNATDSQAFRDQIPGRC